MKAIYQPYYTKSVPIVKYMIDMLDVKNGMRVLEPCAGDGVFVDALNSKISNLSIDIFELDPVAIKILRNKYESFPNISIYSGDTLTDHRLSFYAKAGGIYDRIIANPPYGAWIDYEKRKKLKKLYLNLYVKETYTLFLYRTIQLLRNNGRLVFIIPDTFLNLHMHTNLREFLLTHTKIIEILIFPSSFFPNVSFGYAKLSIITLEKCLNKAECLSNKFRVITGFKKVDDIGKLQNERIPYLKTYNFKQKDVYSNLDHALFISDDENIMKLINNSTKRIGDIASCVTGIYTGNDKKYLRVKSHSFANSKRYLLVNPDEICTDYLDIDNLLEGLDGKATFIPIVKGVGKERYVKESKWYIDWSTEAVKHYKRDKKARFQNSQYYFKEGIGVSMVKTKGLKAFLLEKRIFDQSVVGVFIINQDLMYYLLALLNSPTAAKIMNVINPTANNSANYIKKIPFIEPDGATLQYINERVKLIINKILRGETNIKNIENELHKAIKNIYGF